MAYPACRKYSEEARRHSLDTGNLVKEGTASIQVSLGGGSHTWITPKERMAVLVALLVRAQSADPTKLGMK